MIVLFVDKAASIGYCAHVVNSAIPVYASLDVWDDALLPCE